MIKVRKSKMHLIGNLFFVLSPLIMMLLISAAKGYNAFSGIPIWSDEVDYWREMYSFANCGFNFGKNGFYLGYPASVGPFGCHGVSPLAAWWWYALLFGWQGNSIVIADFILIELSTVLFVLLARPNFKQSVLLALLTLLFVPLILYMDTSMMEIPCYAGIIIYWGLFSYYEKEQNTRRFLLLIICVLYCSILRICYIILLFPALMKHMNYKFNTRLMFSLFLYFLVFAGLLIISNLFTAGYPSGFSARLYSAESIREKAHLLCSNILRNTIAFFNPSSDDRIQFVQRLFYLTICLLLIFKSFFKWDSGGVVYCFSIQHFCLALVPSGLLLMNIVLYDVFNWRDYRTLSPMLYGILAYLIVSSELQRKKPFLSFSAAFIVLTFILMFFRLDPQFKQIRPPQINSMSGSGYSVLEQHRNSDSIVAVQGNLMQNIDLYASIPPEYGIMNFYDFNSLAPFKPDFVISMSQDETLQSAFSSCGNIGDYKLYQKKNIK